MLPFPSSVECIESSKSQAHKHKGTAFEPGVTLQQILEFPVALCHQNEAV